jgi:hypothetical protein
MSMEKKLVKSKVNKKPFDESFKNKFMQDVYDSSKNDFLGIDQPLENVKQNIDKVDLEKKQDTHKSKNTI